ncbi:Uncharacterized protein K02A2.1 [Durusdinium trenchii]|uniref:Uncharacterized protein K02A2.1 n=1 Tax=Durusdinium trenchii TaxID=1381693 RepID=A0ABP0PVS1_9DINO
MAKDAAYAEAVYGLQLPLLQLQGAGPFSVEPLLYQDEAGRARLHGRVVRARSGSNGAGVVVIHTAVGPRDLYLHWRAEVLAAQGYTVLIADLLGDEPEAKPEWNSRARQPLDDRALSRKRRTTVDDGPRHGLVHAMATGGPSPAAVEWLYHASSFAYAAPSPVHEALVEATFRRCRYDARCASEAFQEVATSVSAYEAEGAKMREVSAAEAAVHGAEPAQSLDEGLELCCGDLRCMEKLMELQPSLKEGMKLKTFEAE